MDWATIEQELKTQTEARWRPSSSGSPPESAPSAHLGNGSAFSEIDGSMLSPTRGLLSSSALSKNRGTALALLGGEDERKLADGDMGMEYVLVELANLRRTTAEQAQRIIAASQAQGVPCLPRPVSHSNDWIKPLLESGADGILIQMVNNKKELETL